MGLSFTQALTLAYALTAELSTPHPVDLQVKIDITPSFSSVLISRGDAEIRSGVNEIFLVALFKKSTFLCCHMIETPRRHHFTIL